MSSARTLNPWKCLPKYRAIDPERCAQVDALRKDRSATQHSLRRREQREGLDGDDHAEIQVQRDLIKKLERECKELHKVMEAALVQRVVEGAGVALTAHLTAETLDMDATAIEAKARKDMQASITGMKKAAKMRADASEQHKESGKIDFPLGYRIRFGRVRPSSTRDRGRVSRCARSACRDLSSCIL